MLKTDESENVGDADLISENEKSSLYNKDKRVSKCSEIHNIGL
jgi:hypothetical protein